MRLFDEIKSKSKEGLVAILATAAISCGGGGGGSSGGGGGTGNNSKVNSPPLIELEYFMSEKKVGGGYMSFVSNDDDVYDFYLDPESHSIETYLYEGDVGSGDNRKGLMFAIDKNGEYLPYQRLISPLFDSDSQPNARGSGLYFMNPIGSGFELDSIVVDLFNLPTPEWYQENKDSPEGSVYLGDWSFNDIQDLNTVLKKASCHITKIRPNGFTAYACGAFSLNGSILSSIEDLSDLLEDLGYGPLDLDTKYPRYLFSKDAPYFMTIGKPHNDHSNVPIEKLYPLQLGTIWTYNGNTSIRVEDTFTSFNGEEMAVTRSGNIRELVGFKTIGGNNKLRYFGFKEPSIGDAIFESPITIGDSNVIIGKKYISNTSIRFPSHEEITGNLETEYHYESREQIVLSDGTPYGDCFRQVETDNLRLTNHNTGQTTNDEATIERYFAKNVGPVLIDGFYELTNISTSDNNNITYENSTDNEMYTFGGSIIDSIRKGIRELK